MDLGGKRFGTGPKELGGAIDLVNQFKLLHHHEFFCKRALPLSLSETHYLRNVVGDTEIRKGEGMELDRLFQTSSYVEKGIPTAVKPNSLSKDKEGQLRKHRVKYHGRNKHRHKYGISTENKKRSAHQESVSEQLKNHLEKKRKHDGRGDLSVIHQNNGQVAEDFNLGLVR
ncbi:hypothetical protein KPL71_005477 [Citrus sinensis]|uniref:Uncharacterized protein n=1 Tax=Citrus sinensis TaxID=2711 RepID=A0ACB8NDP8_CITSI|nr:hypothetical protein KPL71_005477 [Citrus sinensis]